MTKIVMSFRYLLIGINFWFRYWRWKLLIKPLNRRRFKREMAKLNKAIVNITSELANKFTPIMEKATRDIKELIEQFKLLEDKK